MVLSVSLLIAVILITNFMHFVFRPTVNTKRVIQHDTTEQGTHEYNLKFAFYLVL